MRSQFCVGVSLNGQAPDCKSVSCRFESCHLLQNLALTQRYRVRELQHLKSSVDDHPQGSLESDLRNHTTDPNRLINPVDRVTTHSGAYEGKWPDPNFCCDEFIGYSVYGPILLGCGDSPGDCDQASQQKYGAFVYRLGH